jgi:hypothetical protein
MLSYYCNNATCARKNVRVTNRKYCTCGQPLLVQCNECGYTRTVRYFNSQHQCNFRNVSWKIKTKNYHTRVRRAPCYITSASAASSIKLLESSSNQSTTDAFASSDDTSQINAQQQLVQSSPSSINSTSNVISAKLSHQQLIDSSSSNDKSTDQKWHIQLFNAIQNSTTFIRQQLNSLIDIIKNDNQV